jgi:hypothetical protein
MKRIETRILIAVLTFITGVWSAYLVWLVFSNPVLPPLNSGLQTKELLKKADTSSVSSNESGSVEEEWEELAKQGGCLFGSKYYSPSFEAYYPADKYNAEAGVFYSPRWVAFFRRDRRETVPFLIQQIPDKTQTNMHVDPFGPAIKGELAIYCLQYILKVNWYELKGDYKKRFDNINYEYSSDQELLQKLIGTKSGARQMMGLWEKVYERTS